MSCLLVCLYSIVKCSSWNKRSNTLLIQEDASEDTSDPWFFVISNNAHAMYSDLWGILPSSVSASGTVSGYVLSPGPSREKSRSSSAWRTVYFKNFMNIVWCVSSTENKSQNTCPFGIYKRNWNLTVSGGIKTLDMIKYNNLPCILQSLTLRPPFLGL